MNTVFPVSHLLQNKSQFMLLQLNAFNVNVPLLLYTVKAGITGGVTSLLDNGKFSSSRMCVKKSNVFIKIKRQPEHACHLKFCKMLLLFAQLIWLNLNLSKEMT